jgi:hypothetical protein
MIGLPLVLLDAGALPGPAFGLWMASTAVTALGGVGFWVLRGRRDY